MKQYDPRRLVYILLPSILLVAGFALANWLSAPPPASPTITRPLAVTAEPAPTTPTLTPSAVAAKDTAASEPTMTSTPRPTATLPPTATIRLLGPPAAGRFSLNGTITFYWRWPLPLGENEQFAVYLLSQTDTIQLGTVSIANVGDSYTLSVSIGSFVSSPGAYAWQVQLNTVENLPRLASETRSLTLITPQD